MVQGQKNLIISNNEMNDIMEIVQAFDSNILRKGVTEKTTNKTKKQNGGFLGMILGTLGASLLEKMLAGKRMVRVGSRKGIVRAGY